MGKVKLWMVMAAVAGWCVNALSVYCFRYPFVYCVSYSAARTLYIQWALVVLYACCAFILLCLWRGNMLQAGMAAGLMVAIIELPNVADYLFRVGGSCA